MFAAALLSMTLAMASVATEPSSPIYKVNTGDVDAEYSRNIDPDGSIILRGVENVSGRQFKFTVKKDGHVLGRIGSAFVTFRVSQVD